MNEAPRPRDATIYQELAAAISPRFPVTAAAVHLWVHRDLLPPAYQVRDREGRLTAAVLAQLEALCVHRFTEGVSRLDWVGVLLWLDGFEIPFRLVRRVFVGEARHIDREPPPTRDPQERLVRQIARLSRRGVGEADPVELRDLVFVILQSFGGEPSAAGPEVLEFLASVAGGSATDAADALSNLAQVVANGFVAIAGVSKMQYDSARAMWREKDFGNLIPPGRSARPRVRMHRLLAAFLGLMVLDQLRARMADR